MSDPQESKTTEIECEGGSAASCQTPTNDQRLDNHETPVEKIPVRAEQSEDAYLVKIPSEIILSIAERIDRQSLRSLALTSARLNQTLRGEFYRRHKCETFRQALEAGDFGQIQRCIEHNAAPADAVWVKERPGEPSYKPPDYFDYRPIDYLMLAFEKDKMTPNQCYAMLEWLVEKGSDMATACIPFRYWIAGNMGQEFEFVRAMRHMPHSFLRAFTVESDRAKLAGAASSICFLADRGFTFPRHILVTDYGCVRRSRESLSEFTPLLFDTYSPITRIMRSACPPMVLEAFLKQLQRQGATLTSPLEQCPESLRREQIAMSCPWMSPDIRTSACMEFTLLSDFSTLAIGLYNDLLDPLIWKPVYNGETGDIWEKKVDLLDMYQGIDEVEKHHLLSILAALRKIEGNSRIRCDAKACMWELSSALPDCEDEPEIESYSGDRWDDDEYNPSNEPDDRVHRFIMGRYSLESVWHSRHAPLPLQLCGVY